MSDVASAQPFEHYQIIETEDAFKIALIPFFDDPSLELVGLLDIGSDLAFNRQIRFIIIGTLLGVSLVGVLLAVFLSQRISRPLSILANEAVGIREGDLSTRLSQTSDIWEIQQLTSALDEARASLKHSLEKIRVEKDWIENLLDSIVEVILAVDNHDRITYASESAEGFLGLPLTYIIGRRLDDLFLSAKGENKFSIQLPGMDQKRQIPVLLNGREVLVAVSVSEFLPPEAGNANRALVIRDVTDEERMHRMLGEFMANITHEFRTPLSALAASLELLMDDLPHLGTEEIDQLLQALNIGIIDLQELIDNLIEAASIEAGRFKVNPQQVSLDTIIKDAVNTIRPIGLKYGVSIIEPVDKPAFSVLADRRRSVQALVNLLSNAVKHSPEGGSVVISILILEDSVVVEVRDEGEGIPPDLQEQLFNRYMTPMASDHTPQLGLGLGLSVVKAIIEAQYGQVGFKGDIERGSIFWFSLKKVTGGED